MKPENPDAKVIFGEALRMSVPAERQAYLDQACVGNQELRQEVESLLSAYEQAGDFLGKIVQLPAPDFLIERAGTLIGRYKLLEKIGEGGFGVVYMAEQLEPVQRKVALKIIKAGMDTREVIARFEAERQALALMDHPNISKVLDGGATENGRPYFVMELVRGIPITDYCDQKSLSMAERLQLFIRVCHAVQHAHQKGIIHRDLKPSNVLVTLHDGEPVPKVIDFGVAKALGQKLTEKTLFTGFAQMLGTPAYMSPEQAELSGLDIDTRTDIYSLGVLLYELLTGVTPFDKETLAKVALDEIRRMIRETEFSKPSTRLQTLGEKLTEVAKHRQTEPATLSRLVRGDLDWIVMKCLDKDRRRRYETADSLALDLERHSKSEPVMAVAPTLGYRALKYARRNRVALSLAAAFWLVLLAGSGVSLYQARRAVYNAKEAEQQRLKATEAASRALESLAETKQARESAEHHLYSARMALADRYWEQGDVAAAEAALESCPQGMRHWEWNYLKRQCHLEQARFSVGTNSSRADLENLFSIQFIADGKSLAVIGPGVGLSFFDPEDGRRIGRPISGGERRPLDSAMFSKNGRYFFWPWAGSNGPPFLTDLLTKRGVSLPDVIPVPESNHEGSSFCGRISDDGSTIIATRGDHVEFYSVPTGKRQRSPQLAKNFKLQAISSDAMRVLLRTNKLVVYDRGCDAFFEFSDSNHDSIAGYYPVSSGVFDSKAQHVAVTWLPAKNNIARDSRTEVELWQVSPPRRLWRIVLPGTLGTPVFCANDRWLVLAAPGLVTIGQVSSEFGLPDLAVLRSETGELLRLEQTDNATAHSARYLAWAYSAEKSGSGEIFGVIAFPSPDQRTVALAVSDRTIHLLDLETGRKRILRGHSEPVWSLSFSPDARRLASIDCRGEVRVWGLVATDRFLPESWSLEKGFNLSRNGRTVLWWTEAGAPRVLDLQEGTLLEGPDSWSPGLAPDGTWLFDRNCKRRVSDGSIIRCLNKTNQFEMLGRRAISENGSVIVRLDSVNRLIEVSDAMSDNAATTSIKFEEPLEGYFENGAAGLGYDLGRNIAVSSDGQYVALVHRAGEIRIYRVPLLGAEPVEQCRFPGNPPLAFGPNANWILTSRQVGGFQKIAVSSGNMLALFPLNQSPVRGWEISPDGRLAMCYAVDAPLVDLESDVVITTEGVFDSSFSDSQFSFSPDGLRLAFPGSDRRLKIWSTTTLSLVTSLAVQVAQARFSQDSQRLTVVSPGGEVRLLDGAPWSAGSPAADLSNVTRTRLEAQ